MMTSAMVERSHWAHCPAAGRRLRNDAAARRNPRRGVAGRGVFLVDSWRPRPRKSSRSRNGTNTGATPTQLKIERVADGPPVRFRIEIVSLHGPIEKMEGDRTHLVAELEPGASLPDPAITLYRLTALGVSFDQQAPKPDKCPKGPTHATGMLVDGDLVLRIQYAGGFMDTFRFHGDRRLEGRHVRS